MNKTQDLYNKAKQIIPGGTQLLSKRAEMFAPGIWPAYYSKAEGCTVWDLDGNRFLDFSYMGIGANALGYADEDVDKAVIQAVQNASMCTLNAPEEVELAEKLCELHPWAEQVRYTKSGGEATTVAVRIARAKTGKDVVLFCGYHGWHDWYLASNLSENDELNGHLLPGLSPKGVPKGLTGSAFPFSYNDIGQFNKLIAEHEGKIAAVIMEPIRNVYPEDGFLEKIRKVASEKGIVLIFDEISAGFRLCCGGSHLTLGVEPDIALFGKALSNGYPMAAVIGRKSVMDAAQDTFISSTYWTDRVGLAAALTSIEKYSRLQVERVLEKNGQRVQEAWLELAEESGLDISVSGILPLGYFTFNYEDSNKIKTYFVIEMLKEGFLSTTAYYASLAHKEHMIDKYIQAVRKVFKSLSNKLKNGTIDKELKTPQCHSGFKRLT